MSLLSRIIYLGLIGLCVGFAGWPFMELIIFKQSIFPNLLILSITAGSAIGMIAGVGFGMSEGIIGKSLHKILRGIPMGLVLGAIGGALGILGGQAILLLLGSSFFRSANLFYTFGFPLSRSLGWTVFGIFIGSIEGIRSKSIVSLRNGIIGGALGGFLGGLLFEYINVFLPEAVLSRLLGLCLLGILIGIAYGLVESRFSEASLYLLNGPQKGSEFLLNQKLMTLGNTPEKEIGLTLYDGVENQHVEIKKEKGMFTLIDKGSKEGTFVNDTRIKTRRLKDGDILRVGDAQFQFRKK